MCLLKIQRDLCHLKSFGTFERRDPGDVLLIFFFFLRLLLDFDKTKWVQHSFKKEFKASGNINLILHEFRVLKSRSAKHFTCHAILKDGTELYRHHVLTAKPGQQCIVSSQEPISRTIRSGCHGIFPDWSIFSIPFSLWKKGTSGPVTSYQFLVIGHGTPTGVSFQGNSI